MYIAASHFAATQVTHTHTRKKPVWLLAQVHLDKRPQRYNEL